ncbi:MAG: serine hydrolase, partial [Proteobacteria bacterium]|nr:serine hydrolase [Pseudomonadota bacterium]
MKRLAISICITAALLSPGLTSGQTRWQELADSITDMQTDGNVPALGLVIFDQQQPVLSVASGSGITVDTPFRWGSITKTFTAMALLNLAYERNLPVDTPVSTILQSDVFSNAWSPEHPVRLIQLAELTAGFADLSSAEFSDNTPRTLQGVVTEFPNTRATAWPPGLQHSYSNMTPGLSSMVVEALTGRSFEQYLHAAVLAPLSMHAASLKPRPDLPGGFKPDGITEIPYWHMTYAAFGALNASLAEMRSFVGALLNSGQVKGHQAIREQVFTHLFKPQTSFGVENGLQVSYAAGMYGRVANGHVFYGHGGDADGYRSRYGVLPGA